MRVPLAEVTIGSGRRKINKAAVKTLADSIAVIGLRIPITVMPKDASGKHRLIAGHNRLEACRLLGWTDIPAEVMTNKLDADLWEIAENLHRSELTAMQRNIYVGRWVKLKAAKIKQNQSAQHGPIGHRPQSGINAASRELGVSRTTAQRAVRIANNLTKRAQREAEKLGLDDNQQALERAAKVPGDENQIASLRRTVRVKQERAATKAQIEANHAAAAAPQTAQGAFERWYWALDAEMQTKVRIWLLAIDPAAFANDLERAHADRHASAMTLH